MAALLLQLIPSLKLLINAFAVQVVVLRVRDCAVLLRLLTLILRRSRTETVWFYTSTSKKKAARPKLYTMSLTRDLKRMYSRLTLVRISINL